MGASYSQSLSASGGTTPYSWSVTSGNLPSGLSLSSGGTYSSTLSVSDGNAAATPIPVVVTANAIFSGRTIPPTANAGPDQVRHVAPGGTASVTLNGSGSSDPDGDALTYSWTWSGGGSASGVSPTVSLPAGTYNITLSVSDGNSGSDTDTVVVTVNAETPPPTGDLPTVTPPDGAVDVPITTAVIISANGSESLPPIDFILTESTPTFTVASDPGDDIMCVNGGVVRGSIAYDDFHTNATFTPDCPLANGMTYTATLTPREDSQQSGFKEITWSFTTIVQTADTDQDGVEDGEDELPDDDTEATPPKSKGEGKFHVSVRKDGHRHLRRVRGISDTHFSVNQERRPHGYEFRDGLVDYEVHGISPGESVEVTIETPEEIPSGSKVFMSDAKGFSELPAVISGNRFTMTVTDGGNGDSDGQANGVIVDPVGVAVPTATGDGSAGVAPGAAGGGCSVVGSGGGWKEAAGSYGLLTLVFLGLALLRRKPDTGR